MPALVTCGGSSRTWELSAKPAFDAGSGSELSSLELGSDPARYRSLVFGDLDADGLDDACVRRADGLYCARAIGGGLFESATLWHPNFGDDDAWGAESYGSTLELGDLDGDGRADLCGRGGLGIYCVVSTGTAFADFRLWTSVFSDSEGGGAPEIYGSLRLGDVTGDGRADLCGHRGGGVQCLVSDGQLFGSASTWIGGSWIASLGLPLSQQGRSLMLGDVDGDGAADLCERGTAGVHCALANDARTAFVDPAMRSQGEFSDALGWSGADSYWGSLRLGDLSGDGAADLCGRGGAGALCLFSMGGRFSARNHLISPDFGNAAGFLPTELGQTFTLADVDGDGRSDLCAAGPTTLRCAVLDDPMAAPEPGFGLGLLLGAAVVLARRGRARSASIT